MLFDDLTRQLYSTDASVFQIQPLGVVVPQDEDDVQALVRYAGEHQLSLIARGAGTGLAGEALGAGLIVDLSKHFRRIRRDRRGHGARAAGVVLRDLQRGWPWLAGASLPTRPWPNALWAACWPPTPRARASPPRLHARPRGPAAPGPGQRRRRRGRPPFPLAQRGSRARPAAGRHLLAGHPARPARRLDPPAPAAHRVQPLRLRTFRGAHGRRRTDAAVPQPQSSVLCRGFAALLVGSEGTLALFTEATLRTIPLPAGRAVVLLGFASVEAALRAAQPDPAEPAPPPAS